MTEVFGQCISNNASMMIIRDDDGDDIEMSNEKIPQQAINFFDTLVGHRISYFYHDRGLTVKKIEANEPIMILMPDGTKRTWQSWRYQMEKNIPRKFF